MAQHIRMGDVFRFGVTTHHPSGGYITNADETPRWQIFEDASDTPLLAGDFTLRANTSGRYRSTVTVNEANGFGTQKYYEVHASGRVAAVTGFDIIAGFVVDDVYNANLVQENSGVPRYIYNNEIYVDTASGILGRTLGVHGLPHTPCKDIIDARILAENLGTRRLNILNGCSIILSGNMEHFCFDGFEPYEINLNSKYISGTHFRNAHVSGSGSASLYQPTFDYCKIHTATLPAFVAHNCHFNGILSLGDSVIGDDDYPFLGINCIGEGGAILDMNTASTKTLQLLGFGGIISIRNMTGADSIRIEGGANLTLASTCSAGTIDLHGNFDITDNSTGTVVTKTAVYNLSQVASGVWGQPYAQYNTPGVFGGLVQPVYYADIKQYHDTINSRDEIAVEWFKGITPVNSGELSIPRLSVYNTSDGSAVFENASMSYSSPVRGVVRYNSTLGQVLPSGEPFLAITSGIIDSSVRTWAKVIGRHNLG